MDEETALLIRQSFDRLRHGERRLTGNDQSLMEAFERLMHGLSQTTDGAVTVVNVCAEAGVSRATYYRSPVANAVKAILDAPQLCRPEPEELRAEVARLKKAERELRREHAAEVRELKDTAATYANQIQALALRNAELEVENTRLIEQVRQAGGNIASLPVRGPALP
ncbi:hypothetical protein ACFYTG_35840 [Streptomyces mirabilis]|uniref:hypothetical protein n=1 Tax=Streptomyces mirabilis TaxID=68239 RepID=UPI0036AA3F9D